MEQNNTLHSEITATIIKMEPFTYEGCSLCNKKLMKENKCQCNAASEMKILMILKVTLEGH